MIPLLLLEQGVNHFYENQTPFRWRKHPIDEINVLGKAFSRMTAELNHSMLDLQARNPDRLSPVVLIFR